ncbi:MAG: hypothetical protein ABFE02_14335 [Sulfuricella sp.]
MSDAQSGMTAIAPHVYAEMGTSPARIAKLLNIVMKARVRTTFFYGELISDPDIYFCSGMACYRQFGAIGLGYTLGNRIAIAPQGARAAIVSHELSHVELATRLGGQQGPIDKVPEWFDEGLAVMVSQAYEFSDEAWLQATHNGASQPSLKELASRNDWSRVTGVGGCNMQLSYGTARQEVVRWYDKVGKKGLEQLIQSLNARKDFQAEFRNIESAGSLAQTRQPTPRTKS